MLEKFLKFFQGDADEAAQMSGSYLSHLLDELEPDLREQLEECPEHDPLPLLVALVVRETGGDRFDGELECPVADAESGPVAPPPPPAPGPGGPDGEAEDASGGEEGAGESEESDESEDGEQADDSAEEEPEAPDGDDADGDGEVGDQDDQDAGDSGDDEDESDDEDAVESEEAGESEDDEETSDGDDAGESGEADEIEAETDEDESDSGETDEQSGEDETDEQPGEDEQSGEDETDEEPGEDDADEESGSIEPLADAPESRGAGVPGEPEMAVEAEPHRAAESGLLDETPVPEPDELRPDSELVLEFGRIFLGMLVENDRVPVELQMTPRETEQARRLLAGYFLGDDGLELRAREMLRLVEEKFDEGMFSQARILLQLFDADQSTRIENDRNLFYEDMILRFGIQRRHPVGGEIVEELDGRFDELDGDLEERSDELEQMLDWLAETVYVNLDFFGRDAEELEQWRQLAELSERADAAERLLDVVPPYRWRLPSEFSSPPLELLGRQITSQYVADYVTDHVKTCYFILRAVGDTGLEPYLDVFFDWVDEEFDIDGPGLMPWIYNQTTENDRLVDEIFQELYREHFREAVETRREAWEREDLADAADSVLEKFVATELDEIPPGHYDFGQFVLDELFDVDYPTEKFPFQMHRIT